MERDACVSGPAALGVDSATDEWFANQQRWARGWRRIVFPGVFLAYLIATGEGVAQYSAGAAAIAGYAVLVAFSACYIAVGVGVRASNRRFWALSTACAAAFGVELAFARADAFVMCSFLCVLVVMRLGGRAWPFVLVLTVLSLVVPPLVPSWHDPLTTCVDNGAVIAIPLVAIALFGFFKAIQGNQALATARFELARLAAENERTRIARDLHDLLGHSLTTVTVKAGLARRLGASGDLGGALREIGEVEALSRRALGDVRAAVANYREVTLLGELATGRELLRAAGIVADFPGAVDVADSEVQELFGWVVREGLTNVVRHSHAAACTVKISPSTVEILDDGVGGGGVGGAETGAGSGLSGLRERVKDAGGMIEAGPASPQGWKVRVSLGRAGAMS